MKCKYCEKDLMEGAKFCVYCGKPIEEETKPQVEEIVEKQPLDPFGIPIEEKRYEPVVESTPVEQVEMPKHENIDLNDPFGVAPLESVRDEIVTQTSKEETLETPQETITEKEPIESNELNLENPFISETIESVKDEVNDKTSEELKIDDSIEPDVETSALEQTSVPTQSNEKTEISFTQEKSPSEIIKEETIVTQEPIDKSDINKIEPTPIDLPQELPKEEKIEKVTKIVKKYNPILIFIIFILLAIIIGGGFLVYVKYIQPSNNKSGVSETATNEVTDNTEEKSKTDYNIDEINEKINKYDYFLMRAFFDKKGQNLLDDLDLKFSLINWTLTTVKDYNNGVSQSYKYATYEDYKKQYENLYGDSSKMDGDLEKLNNESIANNKNSDLGEGYVSWAGNWRPVSYQNFKLAATEVIDEENGYIVKGIYTYEEETKQKSGDFEIKYSTSDDKEWLTSIILN